MSDLMTRHDNISKCSETLKLVILENCKDSRERSLALTKLEECVMWANKSIWENQ